MTSVEFTPGKAQGSGNWGVVGDVKTLENTGAPLTFTYGLDINQKTGSLTVSDSGKVGFSARACDFFQSSTPPPCQAGTPSVADYKSLKPSNGTADKSVTEYEGAGTFAVSGSPDATRSANTGLGRLFSSFADRTNVNYPATVNNGPRGIVHTDDGNAWVVNSEASAPVDANPAVPGAVDRYDENLTKLAGAGFTGTFAQQEVPGVFYYRTGIDTTPAGEVIANSEVGRRLNVFNNDGTFKNSIKLDIDGDPKGAKNRAPYSVGVDQVDGSIYVPLTNFRPSTPDFPTPFLEKRSADGTPIAQFTSPALTPGQVVFGAEIEPKTQHVFSWSEGALNAGGANGDVVEWDKDGKQIQIYSPGNAVGQFPGMTSVRAIDFDANGRMFITAGQGTDSTRVMVLGKTPDPVSSVCATLDGTTARLQIECGESDDDTVPYQQTALLDYVIEGSSDGGSTWTVLDKAKGVSADREQTVTIPDADADADADYQFRVSGWNEAGNGDTLVAGVTDYVVVDDAVTADEDEVASVDTVTNDTGTADPTARQLVDGGGKLVDTVQVEEGEYSIEGTVVSFKPKAGFSGTATPATVSTMVGACDLRSTVNVTITADVDPENPADPGDPTTPTTPGDPAGPSNPTTPDVDVSPAAGVLPDAGSQIAGWLLPTGLLAMAVGATLILVRRRNRLS